MIFNGPSKNHGKLLVITRGYCGCSKLLRSAPSTSFGFHTSRKPSGHSKWTPASASWHPAPAPSGSQWLPATPKFKILEKKVKPLSIEPQKAPKISKSPKILESKFGTVFFWGQHVAQRSMHSGSDKDQCLVDKPTPPDSMAWQSQPRLKAMYKYVQCTVYVQCISLPM